MRGAQARALARSHKAPLGDAQMSEERSSICESQSDWLGASQTEEVSEMVRHSEKGDFDLPLSCWTHIPFQALCPREPKMRSPCPRKYWRRRGRGKQTARCHLNIHPLMVQQIHAGSSMVPSAPILPKNGLWSNHERMQEYAYLARLRGGAAIPLALLTQRTGTTVANAGCIHQPQAPISLLPPLLESERAACWTAQCSIGLKRKVSSGEATRFPGGGRRGWTISRGRSGFG